MKAQAKKFCTAELLSHSINAAPSLIENAYQHLNGQFSNAYALGLAMFDKVISDETDRIIKEAEAEATLKHFFNSSII